MSSSIIYSAHGIHYSEVCGQINGYQFKTPDRYPPLYSSNAIPNIENCNTYVDGVLPLLMAAILVNISGLMLVVCVRQGKLMILPMSVHVIMTVIIPIL